MITAPTTPASRITRLMNEGARIVAVLPGEKVIDISHDVTGMLEVTGALPQPLAPGLRDTATALPRRPRGAVDVVTVGFDRT